MKKEETLIQVQVKKIIYFPPSKNYAIILSEGKSKLQLPIIIGTYEAQAIALGIEEIEMPRPMTHDLVSKILKNESIKIDRIIITELIEGTFYSNIIYTNHAKETKIIDSRPSDAIAIALRTDSNIYVAKEVMEEAGQKSNIENMHSKEKSLHNPSNNIEIFDKIHELKVMMEEAIAIENYERAANLRDQIKTLESKSHN